MSNSKDPGHVTLRLGGKKNIPLLLVYSSLESSQEILEYGVNRDNVYRPQFNKELQHVCKSLNWDLNYIL